MATEDDRSNVDEFIDSALPEEERIASPAPEPDDDGDDDDEAPPAPAATRPGQPPQAQAKGQRPTGKWAERKRERGKLIAELRGRAERAEKAAEEAQRRAEERFREIEQRMQQGQQSQRQEPAADPIAAELKEVNAAIQAELRLLAAHDPAKGEPSYERYNQLNERKADLIGTAAARREIARMQQSGQPRTSGMTPEEVARVARYQTVAQDFPWLDDPQHIKAARAAGAYRQFLIMAGRPDSIETDREACAHVAAQPQWNLGGARRPAPTLVDRERAGGLPPSTRLPSRQTARPAVDLDRLDRRMFRGTGLPKERLRAIVDEAVDE